MTLQDLLTSSGSYIVGNFQLVHAVLRLAKFYTINILEHFSICLEVILDLKFPKKVVELSIMFALYWKS